MMKISEEAVAAFRAAIDLRPNVPPDSERAAWVRRGLEAAAPHLAPDQEARWPGYGVCSAEGRWGPCVFVAGHHEVENWTPHADMFGRTWNSQPAEEAPE